jgi:DUF2934 family protein
MEVRRMSEQIRKEPGISQEEISVRAYYLWQERGRPIGTPHHDWYRAEQEIRQQKPKAAQAPSTGLSAKPAKRRLPDGMGSLASSR